MDRITQLSPLGLQRLRLLECLGGNSRHAPGFFAPAIEVDIRAAFAAHIRQLSDRWGDDTDRLLIALLAAARVLSGDVAAAYQVLDRFPAATVITDHGAGMCLTAPFHALSHALPLPDTLRDIGSWLDGSASQAALRAWISEHRDRLRWLDVEGCYRLEHC